MQVSLDGKVALVTGGSRGIGKAIAAGFVEAGASVMISSRKQDALDAAAAEIGGDVATFAANAGEPGSAEACVDATIERFGRLDILVNNAATNPYYGPTLEVDRPRYDKTFQVNLAAPLFWSQVAYDRAFREQPGVIVNIASGSAFLPIEGLTAYGASKAAVVAFSRSLALELAPHIRVNVVSPGTTASPPVKQTMEARGPEAFAEFLKHIPMGRLAEPEDIAEAILFVASDRASHITGTTLPVNGGSLMR